jgi:hypothetical protein
MYTASLGSTSLFSCPDNLGLGTSSRSRPPCHQPTHCLHVDLQLSFTTGPRSPAVEDTGTKLFVCLPLILTISYFLSLALVSLSIYRAMTFLPFSSLPSRTNVAVCREAHARSIAQPLGGSFRDFSTPES